MDPLKGSKDITNIRPQSIKDTLKKIFVLGLTVMALAVVAFFVLPIFTFFIQTNGKMDRLNDHAKILEKELNGYVLVDGQPIVSRGIVDGDVLTARDDPLKSTFAQASLKVNTPLAYIDSEIGGNLTKYGFVREGDINSPYYGANVNAGAYKGIGFRYLKGDKLMRIVYRFDQEYICPEGYVCKYTPDNDPSLKVYPLSEFSKLNVIGVEINLSDKSSNFNSGYSDPYGTY